MVGHGSEAPGKSTLRAKSKAKEPRWFQRICATLKGRSSMGMHTFDFKYCTDPKQRFESRDFSA
jgi:hypothetical protein